MPVCSYKPNRRGVGDSESCQFGNEKLIKIESSHFCRFHLPWSPIDFFERFGIEIHNDHEDRPQLKDHWDDNQKLQLNSEIVALLQRGGDLTGVIATADLELSQSSTNIVFPDGLFPSKFEIQQSASVVDLRFATFLGPAVFNRNISNRLDLSKASFKNRVTFAADRQFVSAQFDGCEFAGRATFRKCIFAKTLSFKNCQFRGPAQFEGCNFSTVDTLSFDGAIFEGPSSFRAGQAPTIGRAFFNGAIFRHEIGFEGRQFTSSLVFRSCTFNRAPRFQDAKISFESVFPQQRGFLDWRIVPRELRSVSRDVRSEYYEKASQAYRALRYAMKAQDAYEEEARFWELEMRAKERSLVWNKDDWLPKLFSKIYAGVSRYGNSIGRPLILWTIILLAFSIAYFAFARCHDCNGHVWSLVRFGDFSFQQTVRPFSVWSEEGSRVISRMLLDGNGLESESRLLTVRIFATVQSVMSLACIALFGFALRRRFRMA